MDYVGQGQGQNGPQRATSNEQGEVPPAVGMCRVLASRLLARVVGEAQQSVSIGASVKLVPPDQAKRFPLPTFELA